MSRPFKNLSKRQREETPIAFAHYLIDLVHPISVLWVRKDTVYRRFGLDLWDIDRDANLYRGPGPIIAHPPCGPWGKFKADSKESRHHGVNAMRFVHAYGGCVEQPVGSSLFREYGAPEGEVIYKNQGDFGHLSLKPTMIYLIKRKAGT